MAKKELTLNASGVERQANTTLLGIQENTNIGAEVAYDKSSVGGTKGVFDWGSLASAFGALSDTTKRAEQFNKELTIKREKEQALAEQYRNPTSDPYGNENDSAEAQQVKAAVFGKFKAGEITNTLKQEAAAEISGMTQEELIGLDINSFVNSKVDKHLAGLTEFQNDATVMGSVLEPIYGARLEVAGAINEARNKAIKARDTQQAAGAAMEVVKGAVSPGALTQFIDHTIGLGLGESAAIDMLSNGIESYIATSDDPDKYRVLEWADTRTVGKDGRASGKTLLERATAVGDMETVRRITRLIEEGNKNDLNAAQAKKSEAAAERKFNYENWIERAELSLDEGVDVSGEFNSVWDEVYKDTLLSWSEKSALSSKLLNLRDKLKTTTNVVQAVNDNDFSSIPSEDIKKSFGNVYEAAKKVIMAKEPQADPKAVDEYATDKLFSQIGNAVSQRGASVVPQLILDKVNSFSQGGVIDETTSPVRIANLSTALNYMRNKTFRENILPKIGDDVTRARLNNAAHLAFDSDYLSSIAPENRMTEALKIVFSGEQASKEELAARKSKATNNIDELFKYTQNWWRSNGIGEAGGTGFIDDIDLPDEEKTRWARKYSAYIDDLHKGGVSFLSNEDYYKGFMEKVLQETASIKTYSGKFGGVFGTSKAILLEKPSIDTPTDEFRTVMQTAFDTVGKTFEDETLWFDNANREKVSIMKKPGTEDSYQFVIVDGANTRWLGNQFKYSDAVRIYRKNRTAGDVVEQAINETGAVGKIAANTLPNISGTLGTIKTVAAGANAVLGRGKFSGELNDLMHGRDKLNVERTISELTRPVVDELKNTPVNASKRVKSISYVSSDPTFALISAEYGDNREALVKGVFANDSDVKKYGDGLNRNGIIGSGRDGLISAKMKSYDSDINNKIQSVNSGLTLDHFPETVKAVARAIRHKKGLDSEELKSFTNALARLNVEPELFKSVLKGLPPNYRHMLAGVEVFASAHY